MAKITFTENKSMDCKSFLVPQFSHPNLSSTVNDYYPKEDNIQLNGLPGWVSTPGNYLSKQQAYIKEKTIWIHINKMCCRGKDNYGGLWKFVVNELRWEIYFRGDTPLLIYHTNGNIHILQIDGDLFYPIDVNLWEGEKAEETGEEEFDSYLFEMKEALKFINIMLYEDMELEYDESIPEDETGGDDYELIYEGENVEAFSKLEAKVANYEEILEEDIDALIFKNYV